jgi:hypothetical protein
MAILPTYCQQHSCAHASNRQMDAANHKMLSTDMGTAYSTCTTRQRGLTCTTWLASRLRCATFSYVTAAQNRVINTDPSCSGASAMDTQQTAGKVSVDSSIQPHVVSRLNHNQNFSISMCVLCLRACACSKQLSSKLSTTKPRRRQHTPRLASAAQLALNACGPTASPGDTCNAGMHHQQSSCMHAAVLR